MQHSDTVSLHILLVSFVGLCSVKVEILSNARSLSADRNATKYPSANCVQSEYGFNHCCVLLFYFNLFVKGPCIKLNPLAGHK